MSDKTHDMLKRQVDELQEKLALAEACAVLNRDADETLEQAMQDRLSLVGAVDLLLPLLCRHTGASATILRTFDETLALRDFVHVVDGASDAIGSPASGEGFGVDTAPIAAAADRRESYVGRSEDPENTVVAQDLDVAGDAFGWVALRFDEALDDAGVARTQRLLGVWCEEIDNYLSAIALSREKHQITRRISNALKNPILEEGISEAIEELRQHVDFDDLILVYRHEDDTEGVTLSYRVIKDGVIHHDSRSRGDAEVDAFMRAHAFRMILGEDDSVPTHFGLTSYREEVLINGVKHEQLVGRLVVGSHHGQFNTFDRDLLERFADYLRQRIVDFNKEYKRLSLCFPRRSVVELLAEEDYTEKHLMPREADVAIMFCDISGFTRVSEQILRKPSLIGKLIDTWSARAVEIIWETGGVFDKMVGDCVIGLWGPPHFSGEPKAWCRGALEASERIRAFTGRLGAAEGLPEIDGIDPPLGVATGLNFCPLFVGLFGPNEDYTGFSAGMNNTARLQGLANCDDIFCMDTFVATLGEPERFGELRRALVKNVAEPLRFFPLRG